MGFFESRWRTKRDGFIAGCEINNLHGRMPWSASMTNGVVETDDTWVGCSAYVCAQIRVST